MIKPIFFIIFVFAFSLFAPPADTFQPLNHEQVLHFRVMNSPIRNC
jgi:hypothetical protein